MVDGVSNHLLESIKIRVHEVKECDVQQQTRPKSNREKNPNNFFNTKIEHDCDEYTNNDCHFFLPL